MNITRRPVSDVHSAFFAPAGARIYTLGGYLCGYAVASLERLFRTRGRITPRRIAVRPYDDKLLLAYENGLVDVLDGTTGAIHETVHLNIAIRDLAVSKCGRFALVSTPSDAIAVFELQSSKELWRQARPAKQVEWLQTAPGFAVITSESKVETWTWPPAERPLSTIQLPGSICRAVLLGARMATDSYPAIQVKDLTDGTEIFSVPYEAISMPSWLCDGKLFVARKESWELYGADGILLHKVAAPTFWQFGHAFSPVRDDAALCYLDSIVFVEGFQSLMAAGAELPAPLVPRELRAQTSHDICTFPEEAEQQTTIDATTPDELVRALQAFTRAAWLPALVEQRSAATSSKFGGIPWLGRDEPWPRCGQCDGYMNLFLQLNSAELPAEAAACFDGLLQVFVCTYHSAYEGCQTWEAFSNAALVRICRPAGPPAFSDLPDPELYDEQHIVEWTRKLDLPNARELRTMGVTLSDEQENMQIENVFAFPIEGDKLLGWPAWQQNVESHACPVCHEAMRPIFQIDSCRGIPALLGDGGRGWVVQCPKHRDTVAFHWTF